MNKMKLSEHWLIGHKQIDEEHYELVGLINELIDCAAVPDVTLFSAKLNVLCEKLQIHFKNETEIMAELGYVDEKHGEEHAVVLREIKEMSSKINEQNIQGKLQNIIGVFVNKTFRDDIYFAEYLVGINYRS